MNVHVLQHVAPEGLEAFKWLDARRAQTSSYALSKTTDYPHSTKSISLDAAVGLMSANDEAETALAPEPRNNVR